MKKGKHYHRQPSVRHNYVVIVIQPKHLNKTPINPLTALITIDKHIII